MVKYSSWKINVNYFAKRRDFEVDYASLGC